MLRTLPKPDATMLRRLAMFQGLDEAALRDVLGAGQVRALAEGSTIFIQGDPGTTCHLLLSGRVKIQQTGADGRQSVIRFIGPEEMYGTLAMFLKGGYPGDAVAVTDGVEIVWSAQAMRALMHRHPQIAQNALAMLGDRLQDLQSRVGELSTQRVESRLAHAILRLVEQAGRPRDGRVVIDFPLTRRDLAEMTGTTLHTVSRTLSAWEGRGIVEGGHRRKLVVLDVPALKAVVEEER
ncbi:MAG: Crp/Fnr family transcriptional regulator [Alphaproteobacteria bacterium]|nr:Crp/Fnr family transcriptional regulator [Alphaproteobacteria bacterium]